MELKLQDLDMGIFLLMCRITEEMPLLGQGFFDCLRGLLDCLLMFNFKTTDQDTRLFIKYWTSASGKYGFLIKCAFLRNSCIWHISMNNLMLLYASVYRLWIILCYYMHPCIEYIDVTLILKVWLFSLICSWFAIRHFYIIVLRNPLYCCILHLPSNKLWKRLEPIIIYNWIN